MTNEYGKLIQRVRKVNRKAAIFMARQLPLVLNRKGPNHLGDPVLSGSLGGCFVWADTPQGKEYWQQVSRQLGEIK